MPKLHESKRIQLGDARWFYILTAIIVKIDHLALAPEQKRDLITLVLLLTFLKLRNTHDNIFPDKHVGG